MCMLPCIAQRFTAWLPAISAGPLQYKFLTASVTGVVPAGPAVSAPQGRSSSAQYLVVTCPHLLRLHSRTAEDTFKWLVQLPVAAISLDFLGVPGELAFLGTLVPTCAETSLNLWVCGLAGHGGRGCTHQALVIGGQVGVC